MRLNDVEQVIATTYFQGVATEEEIYKTLQNYFAWEAECGESTVVYDLMYTHEFYSYVEEFDPEEVFGMGLAIANKLEKPFNKYKFVLINCENNEIHVFDNLMDIFMSHILEWRYLIESIDIDRLPDKLQDMIWIMNGKYEELFRFYGKK